MNRGAFANCSTCGRFMRLSGGASSAAMYDMVGMQMSHEAYRCAKCTEKHGPIESNAKPADGDMRPYQSIHT